MMCECLNDLDFSSIQQNNTESMEFSNKLTLYALGNCTFEGKKAPGEGFEPSRPSRATSFLV